MKIGFLARANNRGLGNLSWEFHRHLKPHKTLVLSISKDHVDKSRFPGARFAARDCFDTADMKWLVEDIDVLLTIETPYKHELFTLAKQRGVKTALVVMYECLPKEEPKKPDLYICPSDFDLEEVKDEKHVFLPCPIALDRFKPVKGKKIDTFVFHNGHGGGKKGFRNGSDIFFKAIEHVKSDAKFLVYSQIPLDVEEYDNVKVVIKDVPNYFDLWGEGHVYVHPHRFNGLCMPIQEALACGMPVITTKFGLYADMMPEEWTIEPTKKYRKSIFQREIDIYEMDPKDLAKKIDEFYGKPLDTEESLGIAKDLSWENWGEQYLKDLKKLL